MQKIPQLENGHIKIANELWEAIVLFDFSKRQYKVLMCILRKTYGFNKKEDKISFSQIANMTGLNRRHAISTIQELVAMKVIKTSDQNSTSYINLYCFNKLFKEWELVTKTAPSDQNSTKVVLKQSPKLVTKTAPTKDIKDNIQKTKENIKEILLFFNTTREGIFKESSIDLNNFIYWNKTYSLQEIKAAITRINSDSFWKDKMTPMILFRKKNRTGENVDYIGHLLNTKKTKDTEIIDGKVVNWQ